MAKPIKLTDKMNREAQTEFANFLSTHKMDNGNLNYSLLFKCEDKQADLVITPIAYLKMTTLLFSFKSEVAWHGIATRSDNKENEFIINDVCVYPQTVTSGTVNTEQKSYTNWLYSLEEDVFNNLRMHGHSHVDMGVTPSPVDKEHRKKILEQLDDDMFYIFMVLNRSLQKDVTIYDLKSNVMYENQDISVMISEVDIDTFLKDSKSLVRGNTNIRFSANTHHKKNKKDTRNFCDPFFSYSGYALGDIDMPFD